MSDFDIIVIGAGMAGMSAAAALAEHRRVLVLERESQPGYHSTGRSAALFSEIYGPDQVRALSRASRPFLMDPPAGFAEAPLLSRRGSLFIATHDQLAALDAFAREPDIAGATRRVTPQEALEICSILRVEGLAAGLYEPSAADIDVHALHLGFQRLLRDRGGEVRTGREVLGLSRDSGVWTVTTNAETVRAPIVVNAAGAWADVMAELAGARSVGLEPRRRTAVLVDAPEGHSIENWPLLIDIDEEFYFKPDAGQLLLSPADETPSPPCDAQADEWDVAVAVDRVETATTLKVRRINHKWAGLRSFVPDRTPVVGYDPVASGFFWLAGQGGYGIQTAPALARTAAALVLGQPLPADLVAAGVNPDALSPARLEPPAAHLVREVG